MPELMKMKCIPVRGGDSPASKEEREAYLPQIPDWILIEEEGIERLQRVFSFKDFEQGLGFTNAVGALAEEQDHHPAILTEWGRVTVTWWTHIIKGLHVNDFVSAAKTDEIYAKRALGEK